MAINEIVMKARGQIAPSDLRTLIYLWVYATISDYGNVTKPKDSSDENVSANVNRVIQQLKGASVDIDTGCLASIYQGLLGDCASQAFGAVQNAFMSTSIATAAGWGGQGHPLPPELDQIFIPPTIKAPREKK